MKVEKHPGPFIGPDVDLARACAMAVIDWYGTDDGITHQRIMKDGIWNDHVAVQAALAAIHHFRSENQRALRDIISIAKDASASVALGDIVKRAEEELGK